MKPNITVNDITIRTDLRPGDLGYVVHRHGALYGEEYGFNISFEVYVAAGIYEFYKAYDPALDRVWICEHNEKIVGFLLLMHRNNKAAQLRYFYLESEYRGIGLGKKLMSLYMDFFLKCGYKSSYLLTTDELSAAASLYTRAGFKLSEAKESNIFGRTLKELRYDLVISGE
jgi:GNAT superfamily N-acetyltransferase